MHRHFFAIAAIATTLALPAAAQPSYDMGALPKGATFTWRAHNGNAKVKVMGHDGSLFKFRYTRDASLGEPVKVTSWSDSMGNTVKARVPSGTVTFAPHDCSMTPGTCRYTEKHSRYGTRTFIRTRTFKDGIWHYTVHKDRVAAANLHEKGTVNIDSYGVPLDRDYQIFESGAVVTTGWARRNR
ncbi:hypothetical protein GCM10007385_34650 [Tateyamaria omphalii]|uniref:hypothetical protein n=1 Tax=Tateyamaria omphalii TaxID=299262 RepID=UPI001678B4C7|nr:hypothetical protein [Tateyamaria omphalii]GGX62587.1 hypothetical protein GCM10007385_34650 [Tateyamaria omphalii]